MSTESIIAAGVARLAGQRKLQPKAVLFLESVHVIDDFYDSEADPYHRQIRQQQSVQILTAGDIPSELQNYEQLLRQFISEFQQLDTQVQNTFISALIGLFNFTGDLRELTDPVTYAQAAKDEARLTADLMFMFLINKEPDNSRFCRQLRTFGILRNRINNSRDLYSGKDTAEGSTRVKPSLKNAIKILFS